jgi:hypothetical protein
MASLAGLSLSDGADPQRGGGTSEGDGGGDGACRLLTLPAGLLSLVAGRLVPIDVSRLRSCCRATRAAIPLTRMKVRRCPLPSYCRASGSAAARAQPPGGQRRRMSSAAQHQSHRHPPSPWSPSLQIDPYDADDAAAMCAAAAAADNFATRFSALRELRVSPEGLAVMAGEGFQHLAAALARCGALESLRPVRRGGYTQYTSVAAQRLARLVAQQTGVRRLELECSTEVRDSKLLSARRPPCGLRRRACVDRAACR